jgi:hypothetical protein
MGDRAIDHQLSISEYYFDGGIFPRGSRTGYIVNVFVTKRPQLFVLLMAKSIQVTSVVR